MRYVEFKQFDIKSFLSEGTEYNLYLQLKESTPQQLQEGIVDSLKKLPKNLLGKVQPILRKIPKTAKNLVLIATLLGTIVGAVQGGDMAKVDTPLDKLNSMTTMSATMDPGNDAGNDVGPGHTMPDEIKPIKMINAPAAPDGGGTIKDGGGTFTFGADGKMDKWETPKINGYQQTHDFEKNTIVVNYDTAVDGVQLDQSATYDLDGKLLSKDNTKMASGSVDLGIDKDKGTTFNYDDGVKKFSANTKTGLSYNK